MVLTETARANPLTEGTGFDRSRPTPAAVIDLRGIFGIVGRQRLLIVCTAALCAIGALIVAYTLPARYTATAQILLDLQGLHVLQNDLAPSADQSSDAQLADAESQLQVVASGTVLTAVAESENLTDDPEFGAAPPGLLASILTGASKSQQDRLLKAVAILHDRTTVLRPDKTFVIDISVWSRDPAKAARIANAIGTAYMRQRLAAKTDAAKRTNAALVSRLAELRDRVSRSAHRVEDYKAQSQIIDADGELLSEQKLRALNNQLVLAQTATAAQLSRYDDIKRLQREHSDPDAVAEVIQSPTITVLRGKFADAKRSLADANATLGPNHPKVIAAAAQVEDARKLIDAEVLRIAKTAESDYERARANEADLQRSLDTLKAEATNTGNSLIRLRELEREAETDRTIYDAFLSRAKEVGEQEGVDNTNSRMITRAVPPMNRSGPPRILIVGSSLIIGLVAGLGLALLREQLGQGTASAHQLAIEFGVRVLAVLPRYSRRQWPVFAPESRQASAMHQLSEVLRSEIAVVESDVALITSLDDPDNCSIVALNLAICAGDQGGRVLLVNSDSPAQKGMMAVQKGIVDWPEARINRAERVFSTPWAGVKLLRVASGRHEDRLKRYQLRDAILAKTDDFDLVVIDGGLLLSDPTVSTLADAIDHIIMVVDHHRTGRDELKKGFETLARNRAKVMGAVFVS